MTTKTCNTCNITKPLEEFGPHATTSDGYNPKCKSCVSEYNREYRRRNRDQIREADRQYAANHRETARIRSNKWREDNPDRAKEKDKRYYQKNRERELQRSKERYQKNKDTICKRAKQWRNDNPEKVLAQTAKRRADKKQATPKWANLKQIEQLYNQAVRLTEETGIPYQVDHIVPLNSNIVCGLHCEANLRIITAEENNSKNNKLIEELL